MTAVGDTLRRIQRPKRPVNPASRFGEPYRKDAQMCRDSSRYKVMEVARSFGRRSFTPEELVVRCWKKWPNIFGLRGFEKKHPDVSTVRNMLYGSHSLVCKLLLVRLPGRHFAVREQKGVDNDSVS